MVTLGSDGLAVRSSGHWATDKLYYVGRYMFAFSRGMKNKWPSRAFVDLLAGPGRCIIDSTGQEFDGSPLLAVNCEEPFSQIVLVEQDHELSEALHERVGGRATVIRGDCNDTVIIGKIRGLMLKQSLGLVFVDNLGLDVPFSTIEQLTIDRHLDLLITFQVGDLTRNLRNAREGADPPERWTAFFGSDEWREIAKRAVDRNQTASEVASELMEFYGRQLGRVGYGSIGHSHRTMKNNKNVALYRLLLASRHQKAVQLFEAISEIESGGQRTLKF